MNNRTTTTTPAAMGIHSWQDLQKLGPNVKFSVPPPAGMQPPAGGAQGGAMPAGTPPQFQSSAPASATSPAQAQAAKPPLPVTPGMPPQIAALQDPKQRAIAGVAMQRSNVPADQAAWVAKLPDGYTPPASNQKPNAQDDLAANTWNEQSKKLATTMNATSNEAQSTLTSINRIKSALAADPTTGPGAHQLSQAQTWMSQWFGTDQGKAAAYQVLSKFLNAEQMSGILKEFHGDGAQVRLGAYESRLIMEQLAANPQMTKQAINQMLAWQSSDAGYALTKARTASAAINTKRDVANFDTDYDAKYPRSTSVDSTFAGLKKAAPKGAEAEALSNPQLMQDFQAKFGYVPTRPSAPTKEEITPSGK